MKKILLGIIMCLMIVACPDPLEEDEEEEFVCESITFAEASQSYIDKYGEAETVNEYTSSDPYYHIIDWWWWSKGFMVSFEYIGCVGWKKTSTYSFDPF